MKIHGYIALGSRRYAPGDEVEWFQVYPVFAIGLLMLGFPSFALAYGPEHPDVGGVYAFGIFSVTLWLIFYIQIFGPDAIKWMLINSALGVFSIYSQLSWIMAVIFFKGIDDLPWYIHVFPCLLFVLFTFLIRQACIDLFGARENQERQRIAHAVYICVSIIFNIAFLIFGSKS